MPSLAVSSGCGDCGQHGGEQTIEKGAEKGQETGNGKLHSSGFDGLRFSLDFHLSLPRSSLGFTRRKSPVCFHASTRLRGIWAEWQPDPATFGNVRRNSVYDPGLSNIKFSLGKNFHIWREGVFQIRADASNVFNHPSFGLPDTSTGPGYNAQITSVTVGGRAVEILGRLSLPFATRAKHPRPS
jgi:hypothetical protein